jgi:hypothetical protein
VLYTLTSQGIIGKSRATPRVGRVIVTRPRKR